MSQHGGRSYSGCDRETPDAAGWLAGSECLTCRTELRADIEEIDIQFL